MKKTLGAITVAIMLGLPLASSSFAEEVRVEKKVTTSGPSGTVVIENQTSRTFKLQGHSEVYTAPADVDLGTLSGKEVTVTTDANGNVTKVERKTTTQY